MICFLPFLYGGRRFRSRWVGSQSYSLMFQVRYGPRKYFFSFICTLPLLSVEENELVKKKNRVTKKTCLSRSLWHRVLPRPCQHARPRVSHLPLHHWLRQHCESGHVGRDCRSLPRVGLFGASCYRRCCYRLVCKFTVISASYPLLYPALSASRLCVPTSSVWLASSSGLGLLFADLKLAVVHLQAH